MEPLVTCVLLTADRPAMTARAVCSFLAQTYERKVLVIFDSGTQAQMDSEFCGASTNPVYVRAEQFRGSSIGALRNAANELCQGTDIIAHWDSDDWSHPYRLAEQVDLLQASRADAVGYHDMVFWQRYVGEAYLYCYSPARDANSYALGTSLTYWRRTWERNKFIDTREHGGKERGGEDNRFVRAVRCVSEHSFRYEPGTTMSAEVEPRMIAEIHGSNSVQEPGVLVGDNFTRVPEWDAYCRERMKP